jgi:pyruvate ferredoxin oxidoreductase gamma subunit
MLHFLDRRKEMHEIRFHGRGGQGSVTAAELLAQAAIAEGRFAQGFPSFGPERRGAPVTAFVRISERPIGLREQIKAPSIVVVLDPSLIGMVDVFEGLPPGGLAVINCPAQQVETFRQAGPAQAMACADASAIARATLGLPIANTAILGCLAQAAGLVGLDSLEGPIRQRFGSKAEPNLKALRRAAAETQLHPPLVQAEPQAAMASAGYAPQAYQPWTELEIAAEIVEPGSCREFVTGNWRTSGRPVVDEEACTGCGLCWILCPEAAFEPNGDGSYRWLSNYCKGCGICAQECPAKAIVMEEES